jgi:hypothetical protein
MADGICLICEIDLDVGLPLDLGGLPAFACPRCGVWTALKPPQSWRGWTISEQLGRSDTVSSSPENIAVRVGEAFALGLSGVS